MALTEKPSEVHNVIAVFILFENYVKCKTSAASFSTLRLRKTQVENTLCRTTNHRSDAIWHLFVTRVHIIDFHLLNGWENFQEPATGVLLIKEEAWECDTCFLLKLVKMNLVCFNLWPIATFSYTSPMHSRCMGQSWYVQKEALSSHQTSIKIMQRSIKLLCFSDNNKQDRLRICLRNL